MKKTIDILLVIAVVVPVILLFWPFAMWGPTMSLILRVLPAFAVQILMYRVCKYRVVTVLPLLLTGALAAWGTYLFYTSPHWIHATFWGSLVADYISPFIGCVVAFCLSMTGKGLDK